MSDPKSPLKPSTAQALSDWFQEELMREITSHEASMRARRAAVRRRMNREAAAAAEKATVVEGKAAGDLESPERAHSVVPVELLYRGAGTMTCHHLRDADGFIIEAEGEPASMLAADFARLGDVDWQGESTHVAVVELFSLGGRSKEWGEAHPEVGAVRTALLAAVKQYQTAERTRGQRAPGASPEEAEAWPALAAAAREMGSVLAVLGGTRLTYCYRLHKNGGACGGWIRDDGACSNAAMHAWVDGE